MNSNKLLGGRESIQKERLEAVMKIIEKWNFNIVPSSDNHYFDSWTNLKFHCLVCDKDFYMKRGNMNSKNAAKCDKHQFHIISIREQTQEEKDEEEKRLEEWREELKEFPLKNESNEARELKIYLYRKYSAKLEFRECRNLKTGYFLPYDIYIPKYRMYIEVNGSQHYSNNNVHYYRNEDALEYQKYKDNVKREHAEKNGIFIEIDIHKFRKYNDCMELINHPAKDIIDAVEFIIKEIEGG